MLYLTQKDSLVDFVARAGNCMCKPTSANRSSLGVFLPGRWDALRPDATNDTALFTRVRQTEVRRGLAHTPDCMRKCRIPVKRMLRFGVGGGKQT